MVIEAPTRPVVTPILPPEQLPPDPAPPSLEDILTLEKMLAWWAEHPTYVAYPSNALLCAIAVYVQNVTGRITKVGQGAVVSGVGDDRWAQAARPPWLLSFIHAFDRTFVGAVTGTTVAEFIRMFIRDGARWSLW